MSINALGRPVNFGALRARGYPAWLGGGALAIVVLVTLGWFILIGPERSQAGQLRDEAATARIAAASMRARLAEARRQNGNLNSYRAKLLTARAALPTTAALSTFLRDMQSAGSAAGVDVRSLIVGSPVEVTGLSAQIYALPITLTAAGTAAKLDAFLNQVQRVQPRAVLVSTANAAPDQASASLSGAVTLTLGLRAFVAPSTSSISSVVSAPSASAATGTTTGATPAPLTTPSPTTGPSATTSAGASATNSAAAVVPAPARGAPVVPPSPAKSPTGAKSSGAKSSGGKSSGASPARAATSPG